jgi:hypothetical protein
MLKCILVIAITSLTTLFLACQESLEDRAEREAREYTRKFCPTPSVNYTRTDSVVFYKSTRVYTYYCSFTDAMDNKDIIDQNKEQITESLRSVIKNSTTMKPYLDAGFKFRYVCHSSEEPTKVLLDITL